MLLAQEDSLRIKVLLNQQLHALRIDEGKMIIYGLTDKGEAKIQLNPNCKDELYVRRVKELISTHVLGSPGGYPVFLKRWTRMGQARSNSLESLLKLGEPEAVVAVVGATGITDEIARRAWWAMPNAENARRMLQSENVARSGMGKILAEFLIEFLPFEEEPKNMVESVRLILQGDLLHKDEVEKLWGKAQRKNAYLVGFLAATPDDLPLETAPYSEFVQWRNTLTDLSDKGNSLADILLRLLQASGQAYLATVENILKKPTNQDVVVLLFDAMANYFSSIRPHNENRRDIQQILDESQQFCTIPQTSRHEKDVLELSNIMPEVMQLIESLFVLSCVGEQLVAPIFARTDAVGSVMRRKIEPVVKPIMLHLHRLLGKS